MFQMAAAFFIILLYRQWKLHGGIANYVPPGVTPTPLQPAATPS
jgi:hypothetical protein